MTRIVVEQEPHTSALIAALEEAGVVVVGQGTEDPPHGWQDGPGVGRFIPFVTVAAFFGGRRFGTLEQPAEDASLLYGFRCVSATRRACEQVFDQVTAAVDGVMLDVPGRSVRCWVETGTADVRRDDEPEPETVALFYADGRIRMLTTPSPTPESEGDES